MKTFLVPTGICDTLHTSTLSSHMKELAGAALSLAADTAGGAAGLVLIVWHQQSRIRRLEHDLADLTERVERGEP